MRTCALCGGHSEVIPELKYIDVKRDPSTKEARAGWTYKYWQGRHAMERNLCRPCLRVSWESQLRFEQDYRRAALAAERLDLGMTYSQVLCAGDE